MLKKLKELANRIYTFFGGKEDMWNTYCIPCIWTFSEKVYVDAPNFEEAKMYVKNHIVDSVLEDCICYNFKPNLKHSIICVCGNCGEEYMLSPMHNPPICPHCGNGGVSCGRQ